MPSVGCGAVATLGVSSAVDCELRRLIESAKPRDEPSGSGLSIS